MASEVTAGLDPVTRYVTTAPKPTAYLLFLLAVACFVPAAYYGAKLLPKTKPATTQTADTEKPEDIKLDDPVVNLNFLEHAAYTLAGLLGGVALAAGGMWLIAARPPTSSTETRQARAVILAVGVAFGLVLVLLGLVLFYVWFESFTKWLSEGAEGKFAIAPLFLMLLGGGLALLAVQPARNEERSNQTLRRLVYGTNLGLTAVMLGAGLLVANVFANYRLPNRLDTTSSGFYTLDPKTVEFIKALPTTVTVYAALTTETGGDGVVLDDTRRLLQNCQEISPAKFRLKMLSPVLEREQFSKLKAEYPSSDLAGLGILLVDADNPKRSRFIRYTDLETIEGGDPRTGRGGRRSFQAEGQLLKELVALTDSTEKPVLYFCQSHGELSVGAETEQLPGRAGRTANDLKKALEQNYYDVKPWTPTPQNPKLPDDAAVVVFADPTVPVAPEVAAVVKDFISGPKKGKLIVLAGVHPQTGSTLVSETGLEGVLGEFQIRLTNKLILGQIRGLQDLTQVPVVVTDAGDNPLAKLYDGTSIPFVFSNCRPVEAMPANADPNAKRTVDPLFGIPGRIGLTWLETTIPADPFSVLEALATNDDVKQQKNLSSRSRYVGCVGYEERQPRVIAIGTGEYFADRRGRNAGNVSTATEAFVTIVDWLRDKPRAVIEVKNKVRGEFRPGRPSDGYRIYLLPLGLATVVILGLGISVWVVRRT